MGILRGEGRLSLFGEKGHVIPGFFSDIDGISLFN